MHAFMWLPQSVAEYCEQLTTFAIAPTMGKNCMTRVNGKGKAKGNEQSMSGRRCEKDNAQDIL